MATPPGFPGYPQGTGVPGPGPNAGATTIDLSQTGIYSETAETFSCSVPEFASLKTPDWRTSWPKQMVYFERKIFADGVMTFPDGAKVTYWGFEDLIFGKGKKPFPSPVIRLREGELAQVTLETRKGPHTIHHHGIEPTTLNDGVGHVSFEVNGRYTYQWVPRSAGTWFYHCHRNTVLHFEMGLFGLLIVDPPEGWGYIKRGSETLRYNVEAMWVMDDIDPVWHTLNQSAGICGEDAGLNIFKPKYFLVNGVHKSKTATDPSVAVTATQGDKVLIRALNASYSVVGISLGGLQAECVSIDGRTLATSDRPWSRKQFYRQNQEIIMATAMRHDLYIDTSTVAPGTYTVTFNYYDWVTKKVHNVDNPGAGRIYEGKAETRIVVKPRTL